MRVFRLGSAALIALGLLTTNVSAAEGASGAGEAECTPQTGAYQWELEERLGLPQDGRASVQDCEAVRALQKRLGLKETGKADLETYRMLLVDEVRRDPNSRKECPVRSYRVTCVDLNRQVLWVQGADTGELLFAPAPVRSGLRTTETRTGWHSIYWRHIDHVSDLYDNAPMPYAQFFDGGQAIHGTDHDLFTSGSGGCVNMRIKDAKALWDLLHVDDQVYIWGKKPGTNQRGLPSDDLLIAQGFAALED
ncbi:L,D-transpeptidase family protein [Streptomyces sp. NBC_00209]|uniref:L,D-transpeptidase family protein n=1 Tax=Streptomyces sp. NBC_00209 TaxID=2975682 RepID=UPI003250125D